MRRITMLLLAAATVAPLPAQIVERSRLAQPGAPGQRVGFAVAAIGDLDLDGTPDALVAASNDGATASGTGFLQARSGATGALLWSINETNPTPPVDPRVFADGLRALGDVDQDGRSDFIVASPVAGGIPGQAPCNGSVDSVEVRSGATGALIATVNTQCFGGQAQGGVFPGPGLRVAAPGDVDGDGRADFAIASPAQVSVRSGATAQPLYALPAPFGSPSIFDACGIADVDGDGVADLAVLAAGGLPAVARLHSGATGAPIRDLVGPDLSLGAFRVAEGGDYDGDQVPDVLVGYRSFLGGDVVGGVSMVRAFSGATGLRIADLLPGFIDYTFAQGLLDVGDATGDGVPDVLVSSALRPQVATGGPPEDGRLMLFSVAEGRLVYEFVGLDPDARLGFALDLLGDVDGDGSPEVVAGLPGFGGGQGQAAVLSILPGLGPCAVPTLGAGLPFGPIRLLEAGRGTRGVVRVLPGETFTLRVFQPPLQSAPAPFALWAFFGAAGPGDVLTTPLFDLCFAPPPLAAGPTPSLTVWDGFAPPSSALLPGGLTPAAVTLVAPPVPTSVTLQGVIQVTGTLERLDGLLLDVR